VLHTSDAIRLDIEKAMEKMVFQIEEFDRFGFDSFYVRVSMMTAI